jgi:hypothetical protein
MPDNWGFVVAAYALAALVLGGYWRWLARRERDLLALATSRPIDRPDEMRSTEQTGTRTDPAAVRTDPTSRSRPASMPGHQRPDASKRGSLQ